MTNQQIITAYERDGLTPEQIAEAFPDLDVEAIKMALAGGSVKFRKEAKKNKDLFDDDEMEMARMTMSRLCMAEEGGIAYRAAKFIINEKKGRHDTKNLHNMNINVNLLNVQMRREKAEKAISNYKNPEPPVVEEAIEV